MCKPCHAKRQHEEGAYPWNEDHPSKWLFREKASSAMSFRNLEKTFWSFMKWSLALLGTRYAIRVVAHFIWGLAHLGLALLGNTASTILSWNARRFLGPAVNPFGHGFAAWPLGGRRSGAACAALAALAGLLAPQWHMSVDFKETVDNFLEDFDDRFPTFFGDILPEGVFEEGGFSTLEDLLPRGIGAASSIFFDLVTPSSPWGGNDGGEAVDEASPGDAPGVGPGEREKVEEPGSHSSEKSSARKKVIGGLATLLALPCALCLAWGTRALSRSQTIIGSLIFRNTFSRQWPWPPRSPSTQPQ